MRVRCPLSAHGLFFFVAASSWLNLLDAGLYTYIRDNWNIFLGAQKVAELREQSPTTRFQIRIDFKKLLLLATANRPVCRAITCGSLPPELSRLWDQLSDQGVQVDKYHRHGFGEQQVPDTRLHRMGQDLIESMKSCNLATAVLMTGDGVGFMEGEGFHVTLSNMHEFSWDIEVLSWEGCCNIRMKRWVVQHGLFISVDEHYNSVRLGTKSHPDHHYRSTSRLGEPNFLETPLRSLEHNPHFP